MSNLKGEERKQMNDTIIKKYPESLFWNFIIANVNLSQIFIREGAIVSCGMEEASANYLMFVESQDSLITDQCVACSWQKLSLLAVTESENALAAPALGLK